MSCSLEDIANTVYIIIQFFVSRRDGRRKEKCVAIGMYNNRAKFEFLSPIENCIPGFRCFETNLKTNCRVSNIVKMCIIISTSKIMVYHR